MRAPRRRRGTTAPVVAASSVLVVVTVTLTAAVLLDRSDGSTAPIPPSATAPSAAVTPLSDGAAVPTPEGLAAALRPALAAPDLGRLTGRVTDARTGDVLWQRDAAVPVLPASTQKTLTAAAALLTLPHDARWETTVVAGEAPGDVVLVGGGDPTLSAAPAGEDPWYRDAARIGDLAAQLRAAGVAPRTVGVDIGAYTGPTMAPGWDPADIGGGDIAPIEAVMLDGGRTQPATVDSRRSVTPALDAGRALAAATGTDPAAVRFVAAPPDAAVLARVVSPPLVERLRVMMNASDNVMAEAVAREVAAALGRPAGFDGAAGATHDVLTDAGVDMAGTRLADGSGLSWEDRLTARTLDEVVGLAAGDDADPLLRPLLDTLPVAGGSGTLSHRYVADTPGAPAAGWLRAKTGSLTGVDALAGVVTDRDGRVLTFALVSNGSAPTGRAALDRLAATLRHCGCAA